MLLGVRRTPVASKRRRNLSSTSMGADTIGFSHILRATVAADCWRTHCRRRGAHRERRPMRNSEGGVRNLGEGRLKQRMAELLSLLAPQPALLHGRWTVVKWHGVGAPEWVDVFRSTPYQKGGTFSSTKLRRKGTGGGWHAPSSWACSAERPHAPSEYR